MGSLSTKRPPWSALALVALLSASAAWSQGAVDSPSGFSLETGEIDGALFQLVVPGDWNGRLLLHAHGYRLATEPLRAELDLEDGAYRHFLSQGWMLAITSYRRNGLIIEDGVRDLENLWDHIAERHGRPKMTVLEGFSMGGVIVTLIAEDEPRRFSGAVAAGAALGNPRISVALTHKPRIPLLFLTNQSELAGPRDYVAKATAADLEPVLWPVGRDGHVNVNAIERQTAVDAVVRWIESGKVERDFDPTHEFARARAVTITDGRATGSVLRITHDYGNVFSSFGPEDMKDLGIRKGDVFDVVTATGTFVFTYGTTFSDVPRGQPIAFATADGEVLLALNYGNAAETLQVDKGDSLTVVKK